MGLALSIGEQLGCSPDLLSQAPRVFLEQVLTYYVPIALWFETCITNENIVTGQALLASQNGGKKMGVAVGVMNPHHGGSTQLLKAVVPALKEVYGINAVVVNYENFGLSDEDLEYVIDRYSMYDKYHGMPGTHDIELGRETLLNLLECTTDQDEVWIPNTVYKKRPKPKKPFEEDEPEPEEPEKFKLVKGPVDLVIL